MPNLLNLTPEQFRDMAQGASAVVSALGIIIGASWAYWKFIWQKERAPRAEFDLTGEFIGMQDGIWLLEISARLANKGKVRHEMSNAQLNVRYLTAEDHISDSTDPRHFKQVWFPHDLGRRQIWKDSYIDPGLEFRNSYVTQVPGNATYVLLLCKFKYQSDEWPAQRLLKVPETIPSSGPNRSPISRSSGLSGCPASSGRSRSENV